MIPHAPSFLRIDQNPIVHQHDQVVFLVAGHISYASLARLGQSFTSCTVEGRLHNDVGVDNEEEVAEIVVCRGPRDSWAVLWPRFQHYD